MGNDPNTGLPYTPTGYEWDLDFRPEDGSLPYTLQLRLEGSKRKWYQAPSHERSGVYVGFATAATGATIRPRHVRRAAREILIDFRKFKKTQVENEKGSARVKAGTYPPNKL